ncbi:MAG TPA: DPP IV N-terminal domain-containing protein, partial [Pontibacter sp.]
MFLKSKTIVVALFGLFTAGTLQAQNNSSQLTIEKIMRDPKWIGIAPSNIFWSEDGKKLYFNWNPEGNRRDSLYAVNADGKNIRQVSAKERRALPTMYGAYNRAKTQKVYENSGDIFLLDVKSGKVTQVTNTVERESNPAFTFDEQEVTFIKDSNLYAWSIKNGQLVQLTDFRKSRKAADGEEKDPQRVWLRQQQLSLLTIVKERDADQKALKKQQKLDAPARPLDIYVEDKQVSGVTLSPDEQFITYSLISRPKNAKVAIVPDFVTASGYTEDINTRTKVGDAQSTSEFFVYDIKRDTSFAVSMKEVEGIYEVPAYLQAGNKKASVARDAADTKTKKAELRAASIYGPYWSENGKHAVVVARAADNKDRWILGLDPATGKLSLLDRQHDDAWINGPGISYGAGDIGWMPDNESVWFHSEESGYSHLYALNVKTGKKKALTRGKFEVSDVQLSKDKKHFYFTANKVHPGERHFYKMPVNGGEMVQLTTLPGAYEVELSPDEKMLAFRYSYSNKP